MDNLLLPNVNKGQNLKDKILLFISGSLVWNPTPFELRKASPYQVFRSKIKQRRPTKCPCRLCKNHAKEAFINTSSLLFRYIIDCIFYLIADFIH